VRPLVSIFMTDPFVMPHSEFCDRGHIA
jgi:hypothetical protein